MSAVNVCPSERIQNRGQRFASRAQRRGRTHLLLGRLLAAFGAFLRRVCVLAFCAALGRGTLAREMSARRQRPRRMQLARTSSAPAFPPAAPAPSSDRPASACSAFAAPLPPLGLAGASCVLAGCGTSVLYSQNSGGRPHTVQ